MKFSRPTMIRRLRILEHSDSSPSLKDTARIFKIQTNQIRRWRKQRDLIENLANENPGARSVCSGPQSGNPDLEKEMYDWVIGRRDQDHAVSTNQIICKAQSLNPNFKEGYMKRLTHWVYEFLRRYK